MNEPANGVTATRLLSDEYERALRPAEFERHDAHLAICPACVECGLQFRQLLALAAGWRDRSALAGGAR
jgi:hypothetical protein